MKFNFRSCNKKQRTNEVDKVFPFKIKGISIKTSRVIKSSLKTIPKQANGEFRQHKSPKNLVFFQPYGIYSLAAINLSRCHKRKLVRQLNIFAEGFAVYTCRIFHREVAKLNGFFLYFFNNRGQKPLKIFLKARIHEGFI